MAKGKAESTAVVAQPSAVPALNGELEGLLLEHEGAGFENMGAGDIALPYLQVVQSMSPERDDSSPKYIEGAVEGMIFDTVTREIFSGKDGLVVVPVHYLKTYKEWVPRDAGGGLVAVHATEQEANFNKQAGNDVIDTADYHVLYVHPETGDLKPAILSLTKTKLKVSRQWNSLMQGLKVPVAGRKVTPPMFLTQWLLTTVKEKNRQGQPFHNIAVEYVGLLSSPEDVTVAKGFRELVQEGKTRAAGETPAGDDGNPGF